MFFALHMDISAGKKVIKPVPSKPGKHEMLLNMPLEYGHRWAMDPWLKKQPEYKPMLDWPGFSGTDLTCSPGKRCHKANDINPLTKTIYRF